MFINTKYNTCSVQLLSQKATTRKLSGLGGTAIPKMVPMSNNPTSCFLSVGVYVNRKPEESTIAVTI